MLADSFNSAGDIFSSLMTFIGNKIASRPRDDDHNLGHGKAEYIYSMLISIIMILSSFLILKSSFSTLIYKKTYIFSIWLIIVCIVTIITKASLFIYTNRLAKKYNNILVKANSRDHLIDTLITTLNLISCLFAKYNIYYLDGIVGILIALWIIISSLNIFRESYDVLMDKSISEDTKREVLEIIKKYDEIKRVNHFNSTPVGYRYQISFTIFVDGSMSTFESHEIADKLEKEITKTFDDIYLTVIHVNPIDTKKES
jgi:cation diffusion facilitator family transporter